ncbi:MAG: CcmD family protein [Flavitalea sp.]
MMKKILFALFSSFISIYAFAQDASVAVKERQATGLRADGKIYVVLAVSLTILIGLFIYLIRLDRKISKMEKVN